MAEVNGYPNSDNDALPPNNPLDPRSSLLHSKSNCQAKLSTNTTTVHRKLLSACIDIWRQNTSPILWDSHQISPSPPGIKAAPAGPGEVDPRNGDSDVYKTLSLSAEMFSQHLEADNIRIDVEVVLIVIKHHDSTLPAKNRELAEWLLETGRTVIVEDFLREHEGFDVQGLLKKHPEWAKKLEFWSPHTCLAEAENIDLVITLGGDGTVLNASNMFQRVVPPVVSFALGSFGFLTRMDFAQFRETLDEIFTKGFRVCLRSRISARIMRSIDNGVPRERRNLTEELIGSQAHEHTHELESVHSALNEVVLDRGAKSTVSYTELYSLDQHITRVIADGVMVSTPTGSTAYNLAAGGPLCHPDMSAILITPICPHSLTFRPVIVPDSMVLRLGVPYDAIHRSGINIDGRKAFELREGDYVQISVSRFPFAVVQTGDGCDREWFESISTSFNWGFRRTKA